MEGRTALIAAIVSGVLAVAVVTVDLQFGLEADLQAMENGEWVTVADGKDAYLYREPGLGCVGQDLRLVVHNKAIIRQEVAVSVTYWASNGGTVVVLDDALNLERGAIEIRSFSIPDDAFVTEDDNATEAPKIAGRTVNVNAYVGGTYLSACVTQEDSQ